MLLKNRSMQERTDMRNQHTEDDSTPVVQVGPFSFTPNLIMALIGALSVLALVLAQMLGSPAGADGSLIEQLTAANVIWTFLVMCFCLPIAHLCKKAEMEFYPQAIRLMGVGLFAGSILSAVI